MSSWQPVNFHFSRDCCKKCLWPKISHNRNYNYQTNWNISECEKMKNHWLLQIFPLSLSFWRGKTAFNTVRWIFVWVGAANVWGRENFSRFGRLLNHTEASVKCEDFTISNRSYIVDIPSIIYSDRESTRVW